jgi:hypothetical protein
MLLLFAYLRHDLHVNTTNVNGLPYLNSMIDISYGPLMAQMSR